MPLGATILSTHANRDSRGIEHTVFGRIEHMGTRYELRVNG